LNSNFGFEPKNALLMESLLDMAGYRSDAASEMQKRMIEAVETISGVTAVGLVDWVPLTNGSVHGTNVFKEDTADFRLANVATETGLYIISPIIFGRPAPLYSPAGIFPGTTIQPRQRSPS
jgi:hypothetical protein